MAIGGGELIGGGAGSGKEGHLVPSGGRITNLWYVAPPDMGPNAFADFWYGFQQERSPWATDLLKRRLDALDPMKQYEALAELQSLKNEMVRAQGELIRSLAAAAATGNQAGLDFFGKYLQYLEGMSRQETDTNIANLRSQTDIGVAGINAESRSALAQTISADNRVQAGKIDRTLSGLQQQLNDLRQKKAPDDQIEAKKAEIKAQMDAYKTTFVDGLDADQANAVGAVVAGQRVILNNAEDRAWFEQNRLAMAPMPAAVSVGSTPPAAATRGGRTLSAAEAGKAAGEARNAFMGATGGGAAGGPGTSSGGSATAVAGGLPTTQDPQVQQIIEQAMNQIRNLQGEEDRMTERFRRMGDLGGPFDPLPYRPRATTTVPKEGKEYKYKGDIKAAFEPPVAKPPDYEPMDYTGPGPGVPSKREPPKEGAPPEPGRAVAPKADVEEIVKEVTTKPGRALKPGYTPKHEQDISSAGQMQYAERDPMINASGGLPSNVVGDERERKAYIETFRSLPDEQKYTALNDRPMDQERAPNIGGRPRVKGGSLKAELLASMTPEEQEAYWEKYPQGVPMDDEIAGLSDEITRPKAASEMDIGEVRDNAAWNETAQREASDEAFLHLNQTQQLSVLVSLGKTGSKGEARAEHLLNLIEQEDSRAGGVGDRSAQIRSEYDRQMRGEKPTAMPDQPAVKPAPAPAPTPVAPKKPSVSAPMQRAQQEAPPAAPPTIEKFARMTPAQQLQVLQASDEKVAQSLLQQYRTIDQAKAQALIKQYTDALEKSVTP